MKREDLLRLVPRTKDDNSGIEQLDRLGFPALNPILPDLLEWLQDYNWPVAKNVANLLKNAGEEIVPEIEKILASEDASWIYFTIRFLVEALDVEIQKKIAPLLKSYLTRTEDNDYAEYLQESLLRIRRKIS